MKSDDCSVGEQSSLFVFILLVSFYNSRHTFVLLSLHVRVTTVTPRYNCRHTNV